MPENYRKYMFSDAKASVRVATIENIDLSAPGAMIDGVTLAVGDRVLVKDQSAGTENGIYTFKGEQSPMVRSRDANQDGELSGGTMMYVEEGDTHAGQTVVLNVAGDIILGETAVTFETAYSVTPGGGGGGGGGGGNTPSISSAASNAAYTLELSGSNLDVEGTYWGVTDGMEFNAYYYDSNGANAGLNPAGATVTVSASLVTIYDPALAGITVSQVQALDASDQVVNTWTGSVGPIAAGAPEVTDALSESAATLTLQGVSLDTAGLSWRVLDDNSFDSIYSVDGPNPEGASVNVSANQVDIFDPALGDITVTSVETRDVSNQVIDTWSGSVGPITALFSGINAMYSIATGPGPNYYGVVCAAGPGVTSVPGVGFEAENLSLIDVDGVRLVIDGNPVDYLLSVDPTKFHYAEITDTYFGIVDETFAGTHITSAQLLDINGDPIGDPLVADVYFNAVIAAGLQTADNSTLEIQWDVCWERPYRVNLISCALNGTSTTGGRSYRDPQGPEAGSNPAGITIVQWDEEAIIINDPQLATLGSISIIETRSPSFQKVFSVKGNPLPTV